MKHLSFGMNENYYICNICKLKIKKSVPNQQWILFKIKNVVNMSIEMGISNIYGFTYC